MCSVGKIVLFSMHTMTLPLSTWPRVSCSYTPCKYMPSLMEFVWKFQQKYPWLCWILTHWGLNKMASILHFKVFPGILSDNKSVNGLALHRWQAVTWTNIGQVVWCYLASFGHNVLNVLRFHNISTAILIDIIWLLKSFIAMETLTKTCLNWGHCWNVC